jgi:hypothetical protein
MSSGGESKTELDLVPITEQIEARVQESVAGVSTAEPASSPPPEPPPLELAEIEPPPGELWEPPKQRIDMRRAFKWIGVVAVLALAAGGFLAFTDVGRGLLPGPMQRDAKNIARTIERSANELGQDELYTFTDDQNVVHIVDDLEKVPRKYRARAKKSR